MKSTTAALLCGLVCISGCADLARMEAEAAARQRAADEAQCGGYGYRAGTDAFAGCMMLTQQRREQQQADARRQAELDRQREDQQKAAADAAADAARRSEAERVMRSSNNPGFTPSIPQIPSGTNCTSSTVSKQAGNAGSKAARRRRPAIELALGRRRFRITWQRVVRT